MSELDDIRRQVKNLRTYATLCTLVIAALLLIGAKAADRTDRFSTLRAERIEIVDADGKVRMLVTGPQKMPGPAGSWMGTERLSSARRRIRDAPTPRISGEFARPKSLRLRSHFRKTAGAAVPASERESACAAHAFATRDIHRQSERPSILWRGTRRKRRMH